MSPRATSHSDGPKLPGGNYSDGIKLRMRAIIGQHIKTTWAGFFGMWKDFEDAGVPESFVASMLDDMSTKQGFSAYGPQYIKASIVSAWQDLAGSTRRPMADVK